MGYGGCRGGERGRGGGKDSGGNGSVDKVSGGRDGIGEGSICNNSVDKVGIGEDSSSDGGEGKGGDGRDKSGSGSWLGVGKAGSKELRCAGKGTHFVAGAEGGLAGEGGGSSGTIFGKLQVGGGRTS